MSLARDMATSRFRYSLRLNAAASLVDACPYGLIKESQIQYNGYATLQGYRLIGKSEILRVELVPECTYTKKTQENPIHGREYRRQGIWLNNFARTYIILAGNNGSWAAEYHCMVLLYPAQIYYLQPRVCVPLIRQHSVAILSSTISLRSLRYNLHDHLYIQKLENLIAA